MDEIKKYFQAQSLKEFKRGTVILHQGDISPCIFYVKAGYIRVYDIDENGNQKLIMVFGSDNIFPNSRLCENPFPSAYYWEAMVDCKLYCANANKMLQDVRDNPVLAFDLYKYAAKIIGSLQARILGLLQTFTSQKIPLVLNSLIEYAGHEDAQGFGYLDVIISHQDIASLGSVARETASLEIKKLKDKGIIRYRGRKMVIDLKKLNQA